MARETKEQRQLREAAEEHSALIAHQEYLKGLAARLWQAQLVASMLYGVSVTVKLTPTGPSVHFYCESPWIDETITNESEEWKMESIEQQLAVMKAEHDAREVRRLRAQEIFGALTNDDKAALKEHIQYLR